MSEQDERPPLLSVTAGDAGADRVLRRQVAALRDQAVGTPLGDMLDDVLAGRRTLRDVARTPEFDEVVAPAARVATEQWAALTPQERETLVAQGREQVARAREEVYRERYGDGT
ncbi:hypothetical protein [Cellulomonas sp. PSBB021]|uniref:hypothetical protein n=1 Tax=Cellulomonas sp. PSBB021 TaxID=2003551 RepID=UPI000B8D5C60|nr:hypothetical protein [Cellulomonas sp. PSBB021]ASR56069.1 hypothetical protein CBP52_14285 [Cellulomonas sp. PSBB021]